MKKGFTLIEMLAVITVLALLGLLISPIIGRQMNDSKEELYNKQLNGIKDGAKNWTADHLNDLPSTEGGCIKVSLKDLVSGGYVKKNLKNPKTKKLFSETMGVTIKYKNKKYVYDVVENINTGNACSTSNKVYANGTAIYFNPETNTKCTEGEAVSTIGTKTGCMKWYTFNDGGKNASSVNMILDHNTTAIISYEGEYKLNIQSTLESDTNMWHSSLMPRLIEAYEVAKITGKENFDTGNEEQWFYFDSNTQSPIVSGSGTSKYYWLFDYTDSCIEYGCKKNDSSTYGYWTSTSTDEDVTGTMYDIGLTWFVESGGDLYAKSDGAFWSKLGIRPVITVQKTIID